MRPKEEIKPIEGTPNNQSKTTIIFNDLINKRKELMTKLYDSVDYNNLYFKYVSRGNDVSFYKHKDSREHFDAIKNSQIKLTDAKNSQDEFFSKLNNIRIGRKTLE